MRNIVKSNGLPNLNPSSESWEVQHEPFDTPHGADTRCGTQVSVLEMDGQFDKLEELIYVESHLSNTSAKFYGEITQQMLKNSTFPGSKNGTGLFQTMVGLKIREVYEKLMQKEVKPMV